jgi:hypothetical protein
MIPWSANNDIVEIIQCAALLDRRYMVKLIRGSRAHLLSFCGKRSSPSFHADNIFGRKSLGKLGIFPN